MGLLFLLLLVGICLSAPYSPPAYDSGYGSYSYQPKNECDAAFSATSACSKGRMVRMESSGDLEKPAGWTRVRDPKPTDMMKLYFVLKHNAKKIDALKKIVDYVSDPLHPDYGKWLSRDDITPYVAASNESLKAVTDYFDCNGITSYRILANRDAIEFDATVAQVETILNTKLGTWRYKDAAGTTMNLVVCPYYLPAPIAQVTCVVPALMRPLISGSNGVARSGSGTAVPPPTRAPASVLAFKSVHLQQETTPAPTPAPWQPLPPGGWTERGTWANSCGNACTGLVTPTVLRTQYRIDPLDASATSLVRQPKNPLSSAYTDIEPTGNKRCKKKFNATIAVVELHTQYFDRPDLQGFADACRERKAPAQSVNLNVPSVCLTDNGAACSESLLDIELVGSLAKPLKLPSYDNLRDAFDWTLQVSDEIDPPYVFSFSYGVDEAHVSTDYHFCLNDQLLKMAARGITVVAAAGDNGVYGVQSDDNVNATRADFLPVLPASSPYVLSVGGTELFGHTTGAESCSLPGGGGFSGSFPRPTFQDDAVARYVAENTLPDSNLFNIDGRGYPDVSAFFGSVIPYCYSAGLGFHAASGTSAGAPVIASIISLLNGVRLSVGGPRLGYVNPWLYLVAKNYPETFNDIFTDSNPGDGPVGFNASLGWDPCSGLGSPKYDKLKKVILREYNCLPVKPTTAGSYPNY